MLFKHKSLHLIVLSILFTMTLTACSEGKTSGIQNSTEVTSTVGTSNTPIKGEVKVKPDVALELLIKSHTDSDTRPDKGYSYDGIDKETGYYMFSWSNPGKGTGASFKVDPYTGDVYSMGMKTVNLLERSKENK